MAESTPPDPLASRPKVIANLALTWDCRTSTAGSADAPSPRENRRIMEVRAQADAALIGRSELKTAGEFPFPLRVIVSNSGLIDPELPFFQAASSPLVIFSTPRMPERTRIALEQVAKVRLTPGNSVDLPAILAELRRDYAVRRLICEGNLFSTLLELDLVDEICLTFCPQIFGGADAPTLTGPAGAFLATTRECRLEELEILGQECFARYSVQK